VSDHNLEDLNSRCAVFRSRASSSSPSSQALQSNQVDWIFQDAFSQFELDSSTQYCDPVLNNFSHPSFNDLIEFTTSTSAPSFTFEPINTTDFDTPDSLEQLLYPDATNLTSYTDNNTTTHLDLTHLATSIKPVSSSTMHATSPNISSHTSRSSSTSASANTLATNTNAPKAGKKRASSTEDDEVVEKRQRNNAAAAKYRQKKLDRIAELEKALQEVSTERDNLKIQLAKKDGEVEILNRLLSRKI
jgi:hypothetical protein